MNTKIANAALNYVALSSALTKQALDRLSVLQDSQEKASSVRPEVLRLMLETGTADQANKTAADAMLGSHAETLGLLKSAITKIAELRDHVEKRAAELGSPDDGPVTKPAYDSLNDPYVGRRTGMGVKKASDEAILRVLQAPPR